MKTPNKIVFKNDKIVEAELNVQFFYDQKHKEVVAECQSLLIATSGKDLLHAQEMFKEAFELWIETVNENVDAKEELKNMGWKFIKNEATVIPKKESHNLPFLANKSFKLNIPSFTWTY